MKPVITLNISGLPTNPPEAMNTESQRQRIELMQKIIKPIADEIGKRLTEMNIKFISQHTLPYIVVLDDVNNSQLDIIKAWTEVKSVADGDTPIQLIK
jgi:hypothetical protein